MVWGASFCCHFRHVRKLAIAGVIAFAIFGSMNVLGSDAKGPQTINLDCVNHKNIKVSTKEAAMLMDIVIKESKPLCDGHGAMVNKKREEYANLMKKVQAAMLALQKSAVAKADNTANTIAAAVSMMNEAVKEYREVAATAGTMADELKAKRKANEDMILKLDAEQSKRQQEMGKYRQEENLELAEKRKQLSNLARLDKNAANFSSLSEPIKAKIAEIDTRLKDRQERMIMPLDEIIYKDNRYKRAIKDQSKIVVTSRVMEKELRFVQKNNVAKAEHVENEKTALARTDVKSLEAKIAKGEKLPITVPRDEADPSGIWNWTKNKASNMFTNDKVDPAMSSREDAVLTALRAAREPISTEGQPAGQGTPDDPAKAAPPTPRFKDVFSETHGDEISEQLGLGARNLKAVTGTESLQTDSLETLKANTIAAEQRLIASRDAVGGNDGALTAMRATTEELSSVEGKIRDVQNRMAPPLGVEGMPPPDWSVDPKDVEENSRLIAERNAILDRACTNEYVCKSLHEAGLTRSISERDTGPTFNEGDKIKKALADPAYATELDRQHQARVAMLRENVDYMERRVQGQAALEAMEEQRRRVAFDHGLMMPADSYMTRNNAKEVAALCLACVGAVAEQTADPERRSQAIETVEHYKDRKFSAELLSYAGGPSGWIQAQHDLDQGRLSLALVPNDKEAFKHVDELKSTRNWEAGGFMVGAALTGVGGSMIMDGVRTAKATENAMMATWQESARISRGLETFTEAAPRWAPNAGEPHLATISNGEKIVSNTPALTIGSVATERTVLEQSIGGAAHLRADESLMALRASDTVPAQVASDAPAAVKPILREEITPPAAVVEATEKKGWLSWLRRDDPPTEAAPAPIRDPVRVTEVPAEPPKRSWIERINPWAEEAPPAPVRVAENPRVPDVAGPAAGDNFIPPSFPALAPEPLASPTVRLANQVADAPLAPAAAAPTRVDVSNTLENAGVRVGRPQEQFAANSNFVVNDGRLASSQTAKTNPVVSHSPAANDNLPPVLTRDQAPSPRSNAGAREPARTVSAAQSNALREPVSLAAEASRARTELRTTLSEASKLNGGERLARETNEYVVNAGGGMRAQHFASSRAEPHAMEALRTETQAAIRQKTHAFVKANGDSPAARKIADQVEQLSEKSVLLEAEGILAKTKRIATEPDDHPASIGRLFEQSSDELAAKARAGAANDVNLEPQSVGQLRASAESMPAEIRQATKDAPVSAFGDVSEAEIRREKLRQSLVDRGYVYREVDVRLPTLNGEVHIVRMFEIKASPSGEWLGKVSSNLESKHGIDVRLYDFPDGRSGFSAVSPEHARPYVALNGSDFLDGARRPVVVHEIAHAVRSNPTVEIARLESELGKARNAFEKTEKPWFFERWIGNERAKAFDNAKARVEKASLDIASGTSRRTALGKIRMEGGGKAFSLDEVESTSKGARSGLALIKDLDFTKGGSRETLEALHSESISQHGAFRAFTKDADDLLKRAGKTLADPTTKLERSGQEMALVLGRGTPEETRLFFDLGEASGEAARKQALDLVNKGSASIAHLEKISADTGRQLERSGSVLKKITAEASEASPLANRSVNLLKRAEESLASATAAAAKLEKPPFWKRWTDPVAYGKYWNAQESLAKAQQRYARVAANADANLLARPPSAPFTGRVLVPEGAPHLSQIRRDDSIREVLGEQARLAIKRREKSYREILKARPSDEEVRTFDTIVIGGGPQSAIFSSNSKGTRTLLINKSEHSGVFSRFGDTFVINSEEDLAKASTNLMPGAHPQIQVRTVTTSEFPAGKTIGDVTEMNLARSESEFLYKTEATKVTKVREETATTPPLFKVETSEGTFYANNVAVGTGLGGPKFPFKDPGTQKIIAEELASGKPKIQFLDDFMAESQGQAERAVNPLAAIKGERVVVAGPGDGGAIGVKYLRGLGPEAGYGRAMKPDETAGQVYWFGQKNTSRKSFEESTWGPYLDIGPELEKGTVKAVPHHLHHVERITEGPDKGAFKFFHGEGPDDFVIADRMVVSAGYDNSVGKTIFDGLGAKVEFPLVQGTNVEGNIARAVAVDGKVQPGLYQFGPATGGLETHGLPGGVNSPRIETLGPRTQELAERIRDGVREPMACLTCNQAPATFIKPLAETRIEEALVRMPVDQKTFRVTDELQREQRIQSHLFDGLNDIELPAGKKIDLTFVPDLERGEIAIKSRSLEHGDLQRISESLSRNDLNRLLLSQPAGKEAKALTVTIEGVEGRALAVRSIEFNAAKAEKTIVIPEGKVGMIGYGSLLNKESMEKTLGRQLETIPLDVTISSFERNWKVKMPNEAFYAEVAGSRITPRNVGYLNVAPNPGKDMNATLFIIKKDDLAAFHQREWIYDPVDFSGRLKDTRIEGGQIFGYMAKPQYMVKEGEVFPEVGVRRSYGGIVEGALEKKDPAFRQAYRDSTAPVPEGQLFDDLKDLTKRPMDQPLIGNGPEVPKGIRSSANSREPRTLGERLKAATDDLSRARKELKGLEEPGLLTRFTDPVAFGKYENAKEAVAKAELRFREANEAMPRPNSPFAERQAIYNKESQARALEPGARRFDKVEFLHKNQKEFSAINETDNIAYKKLAEAANAGQSATPMRSVLLESAVTKELNDVVVKDKDLVTALLNLQKDVVWGPISRDPLLSKALLGKYSDFKSMKFSFSSIVDGVDRSVAIDRRLKEIFTDFNNRYGAFLDNVAKAEKWDEAKGLLSGKRENWHHMGIGSTPDEANWAARQSRSMLDENGLASPRTFREVQARATNDLKAIEARRTELSSKFSKVDGMFVDAGNGKMILSAETNETIRKAKPDAVREALETRFRQKFTDDEVAAFKDYVAKADAVSPDLYLDKRVIIPLAERRNGIISADFKGQNARNLEETMRAMAMTEGKSVAEQMRAIRAGEEAATRVLDAKKAKFREAVLKIDPSAEKHIYFSGDDGIYLPPRQLTEAEKRQLLNTVSNGPDELRLTFNLSSFADNGAHIPETALSKFVGEAEEVEKDLRKQMIGPFPREQMNKTQIVIDVEPLSAGGKKISVYLGGENTPAQTKAMQDWVTRHLEKAGFEKPVVEVIPAKVPERLPASTAVENPGFIRSSGDSRAGQPIGAAPEVRASKLRETLTARGYTFEEHIVPLSGIDGGVARPTSMFVIKDGPQTEWLAKVSKNLDSKQSVEVRLYDAADGRSGFSAIRADTGRAYVALNGSDILDNALKRPVAVHEIVHAVRTSPAYQAAKWDRELVKAQKAFDSTPKPDFFSRLLNTDAARQYKNAETRLERALATSMSDQTAASRVKITNTEGKTVALDEIEAHAKGARSSLALTKELDPFKPGDQIAIEALRAEARWQHATFEKLAFDSTPTLEKARQSLSRLEVNGRTAHLAIDGKTISFDLSQELSAAAAKQEVEQLLTQSIRNSEARKLAGRETSQQLEKIATWEKNHAHVDTRAAHWVKDQKCLSCHTVLPLAFSRMNSMDSTAKSVVADVRKYIEARADNFQQATPWYQGHRVSQSQGSESVISALMIASEESGRAVPSSLARKVFENMRTTQSADGSWKWLDFQLEPFESQRGGLFGNTMASVALARAHPEILADPKMAQSLESLKGFLRKEAERTNLNTMDKATLLWADSAHPDLLTSSQSKKFLGDVLAAQKADGGFSMNDLGSWSKKGQAGSDNGDAFATSYVLHAVKDNKAITEGTEEAARWKRGLNWLSEQQNADGTFKGLSVNKNSPQNHGFMSDFSSNMSSALLERPRGVARFEALADLSRLDNELRVATPVRGPPPRAIAEPPPAFIRSAAAPDLAMIEQARAEITRARAALDQLPKPRWYERLFGLKNARNFNAARAELIAVEKRHSQLFGGAPGSRMPAGFFSGASPVPSNKFTNDLSLPAEHQSLVKQTAARYGAAEVPVSNWQDVINSVHKSIDGGGGAGMKKAQKLAQFAADLDEAVIKKLPKEQRKSLNYALGSAISKFEQFAPSEYRKLSTGADMPFGMDAANVVSFDRYLSYTERYLKRDESFISGNIIGRDTIREMEAHNRFPAYISHDMRHVHYASGHPRAAATIFTSARSKNHDRYMMQAAAYEAVDTVQYSEETKLARYFKTKMGMDIEEGMTYISRATDDELKRIQRESDTTEAFDRIRESYVGWSPRTFPGEDLDALNAEVDWMVLNFSGFRDSGYPNIDEILKYSNSPQFGQDRFRWVDNNNEEKNF